MSIRQYTKLRLTGKITMKSEPQLVDVISSLNSDEEGTNGEEKNTVDEIKRLIDEGVNINQQFGPEKLTLLHRAIIHCKPLIVEAILKYGQPNLLLTDIDGNSALHMAAAYRDGIEQAAQTDEMLKEKRIARAIIKYSKTINLQNNFGNTPLHVAAINGNAYVVKILIEKDYLFPQQKLLSIKNKAGRTVLHEVIASGKQGIEILRLLLRVASQQDIAEKNAWNETPLQMLERLIIERDLLKNKHSDLLSLSAKLFKTANTLSKQNQVLKSKQKLIKAFDDLEHEIINLFLRIKQLPLDIEELFIGITDLYPELSSPKLGTFNQILSEINKISIKFPSNLKRLSELNIVYIKGLSEVKEILLQQDYYAWKETIISLPSSFSKYGEELPNPSLYQEFIYNENYQQVKFLYDEAISLFNNQKFQQAIEKLKGSIQQYKKYFPDHINLANAHYDLGLCYQKQADDLNALNHFEESKTIYLKLQAYPQLEKVYQVLVEIQIKQLKANYQATQLAILEDAQRSNQEKLCAHLALASFYNLIRKELQVESASYNDALYQSLIIYESYHYNLAYEWMQGTADPTARLVLQREMGISVDNVKLGTTNIQQCVAVFAYYYSPDNSHEKKLVLSHFDRFSQWTFMEKLLSQFPKGAKLDIYLTGGRDRSDHGIVISDNNINQVLKQLYYHRDQINIRAADLGAKASPPAVVFDPEILQLVHSVAQYPDASLSSRAAQMSLNLNKMGDIEYLYPLSVIDFRNTENNRKRYLKPDEQQQLIDLYQYHRSQANLQSQPNKSWFHNQILYCLLKLFYTENAVVDNVNDPILDQVNSETLQSVFQALQNSESQTETLPSFLSFEQTSAPTLDLIDFSVKPTIQVNLENANPLKRPFSETASSSNQKKSRLQAPSRSFETATARGEFNYWLEQPDIADIARIVFTSFQTQSGNSRFEIIANQAHLEIQLKKFENAVLREQASSGRFTLIINLNHNHWVTLVVHYQQNRWRAFYMNSNSDITQPIPETILSPLHSLNIEICNLSRARQHDRVNCGLWALESAALINQQLNSHSNWQGMFWDELLNQKGLNTHFFQEQRKRYAVLLRNDIQRTLRQALREADWLNNPWQMQSCGKRSKRSIGSCFPENSDSERLNLLRQAESLSNELIKSNHLQKGWIPILATAREVTNGEVVTFYNSKTQEEKTILLSQKTIVPFIEKLQRVYKNLHGALKFISRNPELAFQIMFNVKQAMSQESASLIENAETVDGLNAAFTIQALMAFFRQKSREQFQTERGPLALTLEIHTYVNFVQMAHGTSMDVVKVVSLVKTLLRQESLMNTPLTTFRLGFKQAATEGVGTLLGIMNVGLDITALSKANTTAEKSLFGTQLAFDSGSLVLSASGMGAAYLGASGAATLFSGAGVIVAGLGIGITGLVQAFNKVVDEVQKVGAYFYRINDAYQKGGYQLVTENNQTYMTPLTGAVITEIDLQNASMTYGSQFIYRTHPRSRGVFGSGKTNHISWAGDKPDVLCDKNQALNIRERLDYPQQIPLGNWESANTWILPHTPISYISYGWKPLPGCTMRNDAGFSILRKLEEQEDFDYDFYVFPSEYTLNEITEERFITPITVRLDNQARVFFLPQFSEQDRELANSIRYVFQASLNPGGQCYLYLNKIASVQLKESHANYTWILSAENLADDTLLFTDRGIRIGDISIEIPAHQAQYYFIDKAGAVTFLLDFVKRSAIPTTINYQLVQQHSLQEYLQSHHILKINNTPSAMIMLTHFGLQDEYKKDYQGKAYYSMTENRLFYTNFMSENITEDANLVHFTNDSSYFFNPEHNYVWRTDSQYQLAENYVLFSEFDKNIFNKTIQAKNIVSVKAENNIITLIQAFTKSSNQKERHAIYHIIENRPLLQGFEDDELLRSLHIYSILLNSNKLSQQKHDQYQVALQNLYSSLFTAKSGTDLNPKLPGRAAYAEFNPVIAITPFTPQSNLTGLWIRKNRNDSYQLINPKLFDKQATYLGSLITAKQQEVFFFFIPPSKGTFGQLYRQVEGEFSAIVLDLTLVSAFFMGNTLLVFTADGVAQKIDALGKTYTLSFTKEWTNQHTQWWIDAPLYLEKNPAAEIHIPLFGITDQTGKALACWYDTQNKQFVFAQPPLKINDRQFHMTYLGNIGDKHLFYSENKTLYSQTIVKSLMSAVFQGAQLKEPIPALYALAVAQQVYLHQQKVWLQTETGLLFSFTPQKPEIWFLEKIYFQWFSKNNCINQYNHLKAGLTPVIRNEAEYLKFCFNNYFEKRDGNFCIPDEISKQNVSFNFTNESLIPIETNLHTTALWWRPMQDQFFSVPEQKNGNEWVFLAKTANQNHYFFNAKEKRSYILPADTVMNSNKTYETLSTEFALRFNKSILLLLHNSYSNFTTIPLFDGVEILELGVTFSEENRFVLSLTDEVMNHYQTIIYQANLAEQNLNITTDALAELCFDFAGDSTNKFSVWKDHHDMVISHSQYPCRFILVNAMSENLPHNTTIQLMQNGINKTTVNLFDIKSQLETLGNENSSLWPFKLMRNASDIAIAPANEPPVINLKVKQHNRTHSNGHNVRSKRATDVSFESVNEEKIWNLVESYEEKHTSIKVKQAIKQTNNKRRDTASKHGVKLTKNQAVSHTNTQSMTGNRQGRLKNSNDKITNQSQRNKEVNHPHNQQVTANFNVPTRNQRNNNGAHHSKNRSINQGYTQTDKMTYRPLFQSASSGQITYLSGGKKPANNKVISYHQSSQQQPNPTKIGILRVTKPIDLQGTLLALNYFFPTKYKPPLPKKIAKFAENNKLRFAASVSQRSMK